MPYGTWADHQIPVWKEGDQHNALYCIFENLSAILIYMILAQNYSADKWGYRLRNP